MELELALWRASTLAFNVGICNPKSLQIQCNESTVICKLLSEIVRIVVSKQKCVNSRVYQSYRSLICQLCMALSIYKLKRECDNGHHCCTPQLIRSIELCSVFLSQLRFFSTQRLWITLIRCCGIHFFAIIAHSQPLFTL